MMIGEQCTIKVGDVLQIAWLIGAAQKRDGEKLLIFETESRMIYIKSANAFDKQDKIFRLAKSEVPQ